MTSYLYHYDFGLISFRIISDAFSSILSSFHVNNGSVSTLIYTFHAKVTLFRINFCKFVFFVNSAHRTYVLALAAPFAAEDYNISILL